MSRLRTGIPGFDAVIQGGLPVGANVILRGPPGPEKLQFSLAFLAEGLRSGGSGLVLTASQAAGTVLQSLRALGVDVERAAREDRLRIIDWYTWSKTAVPEIEEHGIIITAPLDLLEVGTALSRAIAALSGDAPKRAVIEMLSPAMEVFELSQVQLFAESSRQKLERHRLTSLFVVEKFWHDTEALATLERAFDGILEIDRSQVGDRTVRRIGVLRLKDTRGASVFVPLTLSERGVAAGGAVPPPPPPPDVTNDRVSASLPHAAPAAPGAAMGPRTRDAMRNRIQGIAHEARGRLQANPRDTDAMFALAAAESVLGRPIVSLGLLDRLEILNKYYPGLWDLKARLYAQLGDSARWKTAKERADRAYAKPVESAAARGAASEPDLIQQLDELVQSVAAMAVSEPEGAAGAAAAEVALEAAPDEADSRTPKRQRRARTPPPAKKGFLDKLTGRFGSSPAARYGIPAAIVALLILLPVVAFSGVLSPPPPAGGQATPTISGLNLNPLYGDVMGGTEMSFRVMVAQNSFAGARMVRPVITTANLAAGTDIVMVASLDNVTYTFTNPVVSQNGSIFTYDFGIGFEQSVSAGATGASAPTWYFQFHYAVSTLPASVITWHAQFVSG